MRVASSGKNIGHAPHDWLTVYFTQHNFSKQNIHRAHEPPLYKGPGPWVKTLALGASVSTNLHHHGRHHAVKSPWIERRRRKGHRKAWERIKTAGAGKQHFCLESPASGFYTTYLGPFGWRLGGLRPGPSAANQALALPETTTLPQQLCDWRNPPRAQCAEYPLYLTYSPGLYLVPRVVKGVAHYICIRIMQLPEHLERQFSVQLPSDKWLISAWVQQKLPCTEQKLLPEPQTYASDFVVSKGRVGRIYHHHKLHPGIGDITITVLLVKEATAFVITHATA